MKLLFLTLQTAFALLCDCGLYVCYFFFPSCVRMCFLKLLFRKRACPLTVHQPLRIWHQSCCSIMSRVTALSFSQKKKKKKKAVRRFGENRKPVNTTLLECREHFHFNMLYGTKTKFCHCILKNVSPFNPVTAL